MWEAIDKEWMDCLRKEAVENLLQIPGGVVQVLVCFPFFFECVCVWMVMIELVAIVCSLI